MVLSVSRSAVARPQVVRGLRAALAIGVCLAAFTGCSDQATRNLIDKQTDQTKQGVADAAHPNVPSKRYNPLVVTDKVFAGNTALRMQRGLPLPAKYESARGIAVISSDPMALSAIAAAISQQTGIPVHMAGIGGGGTGGGMASGGAQPAGLPGSIGSSITSAPPTASAARASDGMQLAYEGPLSGLLERVAGYYGINWRYDGSTISITRFETRIFSVEALPGTQSASDGMDGGNSSGGGGGGSSGGGGGGSGGSSSSSSSSSSSLTQTSKFSIDFKYWDELGQVLTAMLGGTGTVVVSPSLGTVTVTTTPEVMHSVADYLSQENARLSRQVAINIEIYSVDLTEGLDFNVAFNTALRRLTNFGGNFIGAAAPATVSGLTGGGSLSLAILNPNFISRADGSVLRPTGEVTDVFTALTGIGDTTKVANFPLITLNNRPVSRRIGTNTAYVAQATSGSSSSGGTTSLVGSVGATLTPGTVQQGISVQLTPRLLDDGRILLQYSLDITNLVSLQSFNSVTGTTACSSSTTACSGSSTIQTPETTVRDFVQQSVLRSGSTLIIGGAEEKDASQNSQGVGDAFNYILGGGTSTNQTHSMLFFAITPQVLDVPHSEQD